MRDNNALFLQLKPLLLCELQAGTVSEQSADPPPTDWLAIYSRSTVHTFTDCYVLLLHRVCALFNISNSTPLQSHVQGGVFFFFSNHRGSSTANNRRRSRTSEDYFTDIFIKYTLKMERMEPPLPVIQYNTIEVHDDSSERRKEINREEDRPVVVTCSLLTALLQCYYLCDWAGSSLPTNHHHHHLNAQHTFAQSSAYPKEGNTRLGLAWSTTLAMRRSATVGEKL